MKNQKSLAWNKKEQKAKVVFGIDEVGRGPLAGPVIACAFFINSQCLEDGPACNDV